MRVSDAEYAMTAGSGTLHHRIRRATQSALKAADSQDVDARDLGRYPVRAVR